MIIFDDPGATQVHSYAVLSLYALIIIQWAHILEWKVHPNLTPHIMKWSVMYINNILYNLHAQESIKVILFLLFLR